MSLALDTSTVTCCKAKNLSDLKVKRMDESSTPTNKISNMKF